jgi:hypothetical protein
VVDELNTYTSAREQPSSRSGTTRSRQSSLT